MDPTDNIALTLYLIGVGIFVEYANVFVDWLEDLSYRPFIEPPLVLNLEPIKVSAPPTLTFSPSTQFERKSATAQLSRPSSPASTVDTYMSGGEDIASRPDSGMSYGLSVPSHYDSRDTFDDWDDLKADMDKIKMERSMP